MELEGVEDELVDWVVLLVEVLVLLEDPQDTTQAGIIQQIAPTPNTPPKIFHNFLLIGITISFFFLFFK